MRRIAATVFFGIFSTLTLAAQPDAGAVDEAMTAAQSWLARVDSSQYAESWETAAQPVRSAITKSEWEKTILAARAPFGDLASRALISATYAERLPGAPPGQYVVIQYRSRFSKISAAVETITPMKEVDGVWRIAGYYIK